MANKSQKQFVVDTLRKQGYITRNYCLQNFISRLGAIILTLKKAGMNIEAESKNGDYIYHLKDRPKEVVVYTRSNGEKIIQKIW